MRLAISYEKSVVALGDVSWVYSMITSCMYQCWMGPLRIDRSQIYGYIVRRSGKRAFNILGWLHLREVSNKFPLSEASVSTATVTTSLKSLSTQETSCPAENATTKARVYRSKSHPLTPCHSIVPVVSYRAHK